VAFGQEASGTATPLKILHTETAWESIAALVDDWAPDVFVVGLPRTADGSPNSTTRAVERFVRRLTGRYGLPVETVDERLTSREAGDRVRAGGRCAGKLGLDAIAACVIVEDWLQRDAGKP
jgi:putative Holliday junction resolvase